ncbi:MAG: hypothetical protein ABSF95_05665 [Verrucomicrobiota bacterium]|jgi:hypothetical protein
MTSILGVLEFRDYAIIAAIVVLLTGAYYKRVTARALRQRIDLRGLKRQLDWLHQKMDALLKHQGVELPPPPPSGLSSEVERLANAPGGKIAAIKLYREQNPGVGLAEAKAKIEEFL